MYKNNVLMSPNLADEPKLNCDKKNQESDAASTQIYKNSVKFIILNLTNFIWYQLKNSSLWIIVKFGMMMPCTCQGINRDFNLAESTLDQN